MPVSACLVQVSESLPNANLVSYQSDQDIIAQQEVSLNDPKKVAGTAG